MESTCPKSCVCSDEYKKVDCSHGQLTQMPKDLPATAIAIDLSYNKIKTIEKHDFSNCSKLREINLRVNEITTIEKEVRLFLKQ